MTTLYPLQEWSLGFQEALFQNVLDFLLTCPQAGSSFCADGTHASRAWLSLKGQLQLLLINCLRIQTWNTVWFMMFPSRGTLPIGCLRGDIQDEHVVPLASVEGPLTHTMLLTLDPPSLVLTERRRVTIRSFYHFLGTKSNMYMRRIYQSYRVSPLGTILWKLIFLLISWTYR